MTRRCDCGWTDEMQGRPECEQYWSGDPAARRIPSNCLRGHATQGYSVVREYERVIADAAAMQIAQIRWEADRRDAERYRKLRSTSDWRAYAEIYWDEAYLGLQNASGDELDRLVDSMPDKPHR